LPGNVTSRGHLCRADRREVASPPAAGAGAGVVARTGAPRGTPAAAVRLAACQRQRGDAGRSRRYTAKMDRSAFSWPFHAFLRFHLATCWAFCNGRNKPQLNGLRTASANYADFPAVLFDVYEV